MSNVVETVNYALRRWAALEPAFFEGAQFLAGLRIRAANDDDLDRPAGVGYAVVCWSGVDLAAASARGVEDLAAVVFDRMRIAARGLGQELMLHLRGEGHPASYGDAQRWASKSPDGIGYAVSGVAVNPPKLGDTLAHLGQLPHLRDDDGRLSMRMSATDGLEACIRFFALVVS